MNRPATPGLRLKVVLVVLAVAAIAVGLALPVPHRSASPNLFATVDTGHG